MRNDELETVVGGRIRSLRLGQGLTQVEVAERANVSVGALKHLESGAGATVHTMVKVLRRSVTPAGSRPWRPRPPPSIRSISSRPANERATRHDRDVRRGGT